MPDAVETSKSGPTNATESRFRALLRRLGLPAPEYQKRIDLGLPLGSTVPDAYYDDPDDPSIGICIYLDGMSLHLHGNPETSRQDRQIREQLRGLGHEVIAITYNDLADKTVMTRKLRTLVRALLGKERVKQMQDEAEWFEGQGSE